MSEPPPPYSLHPPPPPAVPISAPPQPIAQQQQAGQVVGLVNQAPNLTVGDRVRHMQDKLDLPEDVVRDLLSIAGTDIVVVADDSGSMNQIADPTNTMNPKTRWEELQETLIKLAHLLLVVDHSDGFHVQFLNDPTWHEIHSKQHVETLFYGRQARGRTPLGARLRPLLSGQWHPKGHSNETELIVLVMTDGEPSDVTFDGLRQMVGSKKPSVFVTFLMCTEDDDVVEAYNRHVDRLPGVDITDDYVSEKREVEAHGKRTHTGRTDGQGRARGKDAEIRPHGREKRGRRRWLLCSRWVYEIGLTVLPARLGHAGVDPVRPPPPRFRNAGRHAPDLGADRRAEAHRLALGQARERRRLGRGRRGRRRPARRRGRAATPSSGHAASERRGTPRVRDWRVPTGATPLWLRAWAIKPCGSTRRSRSCLDARRGWGGRAQ